MYQRYLEPVIEEFTTGEYYREVYNAKQEYFETIQNLPWVKAVDASSAREVKDIKVLPKLKNLVEHFSMLRCNAYS